MHTSAFSGHVAPEKRQQNFAHNEEQKSMCIILKNAAVLFVASFIIVRQAVK